MTPAVVVRAEAAADRAGVRRINELAFEGAAEADLVEALHRDGLVLSSLVAEVDGDVVGHILFSRMWVDGAAAAGRRVPGAGGRRAVASAARHWRPLISRGLDEMRRLGERMVIVVGHPGYYPRFGFELAQPRGLTSPFPPEAFMAMELVPGALRGVAGAVRYPAAFGI